MDLLQSVRKEGSRGGVNFSWSDVANSDRREAYLGHSLKAPVGRWQKNKDLSWYARAEDADLTSEERAKKEADRKREEMRKVKEAEEDAMAKALGLPVPDSTANANLEPLGLEKGKQGEVNLALKEVLGGDDDGVDEEEAKGVRKDRKEGGQRRYRHHHRRHREDEGEGRRRHRSMSRDRERRHRQRHHSRSRSRSPERERRRDDGRGERKHESRSRDRRRDDARHRKRRDYDYERENRRRDSSRSRSPYPKGEERRK